jgi:hypothetical protein
VLLDGQMGFPSSSALAHDWIALHTSLALPTGARPRVHDTKNISTHEQKPERTFSDRTLDCKHTQLTATPLPQSISNNNVLNLPEIPMGRLQHTRLDLPPPPQGAWKMLLTTTTAEPT